MINKEFINLLPLDILISSNEEEMFKIEYIIKSNDINYESFSKYILDNNLNEKLIISLYKYIMHIVDIETLEIINDLNINFEVKNKISVDISELIFIVYKNGLIYYDCDKRNYMIITKRFNNIPDKYKTKLTKWLINELKYSQSLVNIS